MTQIKKLIHSTYFMIAIYIFTFISWFLGGDTFGIDSFSPFNIYGLFLLIIILSLVLIIEKNTLYAIPVLSSFLFIISNSSITFDTLGSSTLPYIGVGLIFLSFIIHLIRFKPKFRMGGLFIGLLLITLAYLIPLLYTDHSLSSIAVSGVSIIYFIFYIFLFSTAKGNKDYLFKLMIIISLLLVMQLGTKITRGFIDHPEMNVFEVIEWGFNHNWGPNFGWANINDVAFYLTLTFPAYLYFIFKKPKHIGFWLLILVPILAVAISGSRGGVIGFIIALLLSLVTLISRGHKPHYIGLSIALICAFVVFIIGFNVFKQTWIVFRETLERGSIDSFSSNRIFIYKKGLEIFQMHPVFGSGWTSINLVILDKPWWRLFMYHSTIIHVLATMGLFGLFALIVHYFQVFKILYNNFTLEKQLIFIGYVATQMHGLIDNVQFAVPYSFLIVFIFVIIETDTNPTIFRKVGRKYFPDSVLINKTLEQ